MTSDLQALLAAVVADPSDDVARLVYADCLEEHGDETRAAFIRLQIEAERHHPYSNVRAALDAQARALFAEHWVEWWGEVCAATGLPMPISLASGRLARLAMRAGLRDRPGHPYRAADCSVLSADPAQYSPHVRFRRGFPDELNVGINKPRFLANWTRVSPIESLSSAAPYFDGWLDGPHLAGLRELRFDIYDSEVIESALASPHCPRLESFHLSASEDYLVPSLPAVTALLSLPGVRRLRELSLPPIWSESMAEWVAGVENLSGLTALRVSLAGEYHAQNESAGRQNVGRQLAALAASPHLANLTRLAVNGASDADGIAAALRGPWTGLRSLELQGAAALEPFAGADGLRELEELRLLGLELDAADLSALGRSPLTKRVKHFAVRGSPVDRTTLPKLVAAVDRDRVETFALIMPAHEPLWEYAAELLKQWFGDRARILSA